MIVMSRPGGIVQFKPHKNGLHYLDMNPDEGSVITLVMTVRDNVVGFTKTSIKE